MGSNYDLTLSEDYIKPLFSENTIRIVLVIKKA